MKCCCPRFVNSWVVYIVLLPVQLVLIPFEFLQWAIIWLWEHAENLGGEVISLLVDLLMGSGKDFVVAVRSEFHVHCVSTANGFSLTEGPSIAVSTVRIISAILHEPPLLVCFSALGIMWWSNHVVASDLVGAIHCLLIVFLGSLFVFRASSPSSCSQVQLYESQANLNAHIYPALCLGLAMPCMLLALSRNYERIYNYVSHRLPQRFHVLLKIMSYGFTMLFGGAPRYRSYRSRLARTVSAGWITVALVNYLASKTFMKILDASGMSQSPLFQQSQTLGTDNDLREQVHNSSLWYAGFSLTVGITLVVWTIQALAYTEVSRNERTAEIDASVQRIGD